MNIENTNTPNGDSKKDLYSMVNQDTGKQATCVIDLAERNPKDFEKYTVR